MDNEFQPWSSARMNTKFGFVCSPETVAARITLLSKIDRALAGGWISMGWRQFEDNLEESVAG